MKEEKSYFASTFLTILLIVATIAPFYGSSDKTGDILLSEPEGWSDDVRLTNNTFVDYKVTLAVDNNDVHIAWATFRDTKWRVYYSNSKDSGRTWSNEMELAQPRTNPDIASVENKVHMVCDSGMEIFYRSSPDGGQSWGTEKMISTNDGFNSQAPKIAVSEDGMSIHVVWVDSRHSGESTPPNTELYYNRSLDGGVTWEGEQRLTNALYGSGSQRIALVNNTIHVVWGDGRTGITTGDVYYKRSTDNGASWEPDVLLAGTANSEGPPVVCADGARVHVAWVEEQAGPVYRIYYRNSTDNGTNWNPVQLIVDSLYCHAPDIGVVGDDVRLVWHDWRDDGSTTEVYYKNSTDGGINWGPETRLTYNEGNHSSEPKIAINGDMNHIAWRDQRDGNNEIYYKRSPDFPALDATPPEIRHDEATSAAMGQPINITANITDDVAVDVVFLNYTGVNGTNHNVSMTQWNGNWSDDIPGQVNIGIVEYFIWVNDTSGNANQTAIYQVQINDVTKPEIIHSPVTSANVNEAINITAEISDDVGMNSVYLNYTDVHGDNFNVTMHKWNGNFSYEISGQALTGIVDYFVWANDTSNNDNMTLIFQIQINDVTKPEINHALVISKNIGELINITANITDDIEVNKVLLNYTDVHGINQNISMNKWDGNYSFEIPGQSNSGFVDYFIWCNDTSNNDNMTMTYQIQIFDITEPEINHVPVTAANVSEVINITANVIDDVSVDSVYLNYTDVNGASHNVSMQKWNGNYSYGIPGQNTIGNVRYFIWANDSDGNENRTIEYLIQINDVVKPLINHVPIVSANVGEAINITVNVTDDVEVDAVFLNYTDIAGNNYHVGMNKYGDNWSYEIVGQDDIGIVEYFIWANDTSGNDIQTQVYQIQIIDVVKPEIEHSPVTLANVSEAINITARITDDVEVDLVYLNYTDVTGINHNVTMVRWNGNWSYVISGQLSAGNLTYFIWANDTSGNDNRTEGYTIQINEVIIPDTTPPTIISKTPTGINVSITTTITITFNVSMNISSVESAITISPAITISGYSWNADNTVLTITPSGNLSYNTTYNVTVGTGAADAAGNNMVSAYSWEFATEAEDGIATNGGGRPGEYWWIVLVIVVVTMVALYLFWKNRKEEEPEEETEENEIETQE